MTDDITCDVCNESSDRVCRRCYDYQVEETAAFRALARDKGHLSRKVAQLWWAAGGGISRIGPFASQREAYEAMVLTQSSRENQLQETGVDMPYPKDVAVWPEYGNKP